MRFDWWTLALQTVNFAVLVWLMQRFLYTPVLRMLDARHAEIEMQYADARTADAKAKELLAAVQAERTGIVNEREIALQAATAQAEGLARERRALADREVAALLDGARKTLAVERDKALAEARKLSLDLGVAFAGRLLAEAPAKLRTEAWLERIEQYLAVLPGTEIEALVRQLEDGSVLEVVTASPLALETAETWRTRLHRSLGDRIAIAFDVDPGLVAGAELHFPSAVLRFSWQSALATARAEVDAP